MYKMKEEIMLTIGTEFRTKQREQKSMTERFVKSPHPSK